jgi:hypothetical protein
VARKNVKDTNLIEIAQLMIGRKVDKFVEEEDHRTQHFRKKIALELKIFMWRCQGKL